MMGGDRAQPDGRNLLSMLPLEVFLPTLSRGARREKQPLRFQVIADYQTNGENRFERCACLIVQLAGGEIPPSKKCP